MLNICDRCFNGYNSEVTTHAKGPHVAAKQAMNKHTKATEAFWPATLSTVMTPEAVWPVVVVPSVATRDWHMHMPTPPHKSSGRRPNLSKTRAAGIVERTLTMARIILIRNALEIPEFSKN